MITQGRRIYDSKEMIKGDYYKLPYTTTDNIEKWIICVPTGIRGTINNKTWKIIENENGTITVSPSILVTSHIKEYNWHGYLKDGIWTSA